MKILAGIHFAYALIMKLFGESASGIHTGLLLINVASLALLFVLARRTLKVEGAAVAVGAFAFLSASESVLGLFAHATHFVVLFALAGLITLMAGLEKDRRYLLFASGLCFGMSVLMKQHGVFFCLFALGYLAVESRKKFGMRVVLTHLSLLSLGVLVPYGATCLYMLAEGVFDEFWFWTVTRSLDYVTENTVSQGMRLVAAQFDRFARHELIFWCLAVIGVFVALYPKWRIRKRWFFIFMLLVSFLATVPSLSFYPHHFVVMLPAVSLLVGVAFTALPQVCQPIMDIAKAKVVVLTFFLVAAVLSIYQQRDYLFTLNPYAVSRKIYGSNPFPESVEIARYIRENSAPDSQIAVLGSEPQIYFYADRPSATDNLYMYSLVCRQPYVERMQDEMIREIEEACPEYVVLVGIPTSWLFKDAVGGRIIEWAYRYLDANYRQVGLVELKNFWESDYYWDRDADDRSPSAELFVRVYRRNS